MSENKTLSYDGLIEQMRKEYASLENDRNLWKKEAYELAKKCNGLEVENARIVGFIGEDRLLLHACGFEIKTDERSRRYIHVGHTDYYPDRDVETK